MPVLKKIYGIWHKQKKGPFIIPVKVSTIHKGSNVCPINLETLFFIVYKMLLLISIPRSSGRHEKHHSDAHFVLIQLYYTVGL